MTEPIVDAVPSTPLPEEPRRRSRLPLLIAAVAVASLLTGSGAAVSAMYLLGWRTPPERDYTVLVFLEHDVTPAQKAAVEGALRRIPDGGEPRYTSKAESLAKMKELLKGDFTDKFGEVSEAAAIESYEVPIRTAEITCNGVTELARMPGVGEAGIAAPMTPTQPAAKILCF